MLFRSLHRFVHQRHAGFPRRPIGYVLGQCRQPLRRRGVAHEFQRPLPVRRALGDDKGAVVPDLTVPDDLEGLPFLDDGVEKAPVIEIGRASWRERG